MRMRKIKLRVLASSQLIIGLTMVSNSRLLRLEYILILKASDQKLLFLIPFFLVIMTTKCVSRHQMLSPFLPSNNYRPDLPHTKHHSFSASVFNCVIATVDPIPGKGNSSNPGTPTMANLSSLGDKINVCCFTAEEPLLQAIIIISPLRLETFALSARTRSIFTTNVYIPLNIHMNTYMYILQYLTGFV